MADLSEQPQPTDRLAFEAIGTAWSIELYQPVPPALLAGLKKQVLHRIATFDKTYSRFRADSLVTQMAGHAGTYTVPPDAAPLLALYRELYDLTGGTVTPLIGQALSDAGYDADYSLRPQATLQPVPAWDDVLAYDAPQLTLYQPWPLDFGAAGKGYLVDIIGMVLEAAGIDAYLVDAGGDMRYRSPSATPLDIGLEDPADASQVIGVARLAPGYSLCGSAGNRRAWAQYHHILDPHVLASPRHIQAVWVVAESTMLADGLTTALFFVEPEVLQARYAFTYVILYTDGSCRMSPGFIGTVFGDEPSDGLLTAAGSAGAVTAEPISSVLARAAR